MTDSLRLVGANETCAPSLSKERIMRLIDSNLRPGLLTIACLGLLFSTFGTVRASAQNAYNEYAGTWLLNPVTSNWTCSVFPNLPALINGCTTANPAEYG